MDWENLFAKRQFRKHKSSIDLENHNYEHVSQVRTYE